jgi:hypothetical protein
VSAVEGYNRANGATPDDEPITFEEFDAMLERHEQFLARRS